jgi:hypothetical protein
MLSLSKFETVDVGTLSGGKIYQDMGALSLVVQITDKS